MKSTSERVRDEFALRLIILRKRIGTIAVALKQAVGFPAKAGYIDLQIAEFFVDYIEWELENPDLMKDALMANEVYDGPGTAPTAHRRNDKKTSDPDERYLNHIENELTGSTEILDQALLRLESGVALPYVPSIDWETFEFKDGYFRNGGRPVFTGGFNMISRRMIDTTQHPDLAELDEELTLDFLKKMHRLGVGVVCVGVPIPGLINVDGSVSSDRVKAIEDEIAQLVKMGFRIDVLFNWGCDRAALEAHWPEITKYYGNSVGLDIDHPGTRIMITRVMAKLMPVLAKIPAIVSWDMANEPFFDIAMWSPHTMSKYRLRLTEQYGDVKRLNQNWQTTYTGFDQIPHPNEKLFEACSKGEWYDRVTFHSFRVSSFFEYVQNELRTYIPNAAIHLKAQDNSSLGPRQEAVTEGIDREMLTPISNLQGVDTRPLPVTELRMAAGGEHNEGTNSVLKYDGSRYGFHWLGQSFLYDYLTSLGPQLPIVDFEYHAFSINAIRIPDIPQSHARVTLWMAHLHGLVGNVAWYWHRRYGPHPFPADYFKMWLYGSISTQPLIAAEYFQTLLRLNIFTEEIEALATNPDRPIRLLVSKPSYIQNQAHITALHRAYEGLCFHGLHVGFVTERMLINDGVPKGCKLIVIPDAEYIEPMALDVLRSQPGEILMKFGEIDTAFDAHGNRHSSESIAFLDDVRTVGYADASKLSGKLVPVLLPLTSKLRVQVHVENRSDTFGVMHRQVVFKGEHLVMMVNVSSEPLNVQMRSISGDHVCGYDVLNAEDVQGSDISMPFHAVRLVRVSL